MLNPSYIQVNFRDIGLQENNGLWYLQLNGELFHAGKEFKSSLYKRLHISNKTTDLIPLDKVVEMAKEKYSEDVVVYINRACALAVSVLDVGSSPATTTQVAHICNELGERAFDLTQDELKSEFYVINNNKFQVFPTSNGIYRAGGFVHVRHDKALSAKIVPVVEHVASGNCAIINNRVLCMYVQARQTSAATAKDLLDALKTITNASKPEFADIISNRLRECRETIASVRECVDVGSRLLKIAHFRRAKFLNLPKLFDRYGIAGPDEKNEKWLASNPSHADRLQLFHLLIDSNVNMPRAYREEVGDFFFDVGDLEGSNAERLWSKKIKVKPLRTAKLLVSVPDDNSDICSKVLYPQESTEIVDDDDIASDFGDG